MPSGSRVVAIAALLLVASCNQQDTKPPFDVDKYLAQKGFSQIGRYRYIAESGGYHGRGKMIDTATGAIWQDICYVSDKTGCIESAWTKQDVLGITISEDAYWKFAEGVQKNTKTAKK